MSNDTLRISMVGYKPKTIRIKNLLNQKGNIEVNLEEEISELNEVVIRSKTVGSIKLWETIQNQLLSDMFSTMNNLEEKWG